MFYTRYDIACCHTCTCRYKFCHYRNEYVVTYYRLFLFMMRRIIKDINIRQCKCVISTIIDDNFPLSSPRITTKTILFWNWMRSLYIEQKDLHIFLKAFCKFMMMWILGTLILKPILMVRIHSVT